MDNEKNEKKKKKHYNYITERERYIIEHLYNKKHYSIRKISMELNREYSTVYREIKKGLVIQRDYYWNDVKTYKADYSEMITKENLNRRGREMKCKRNDEFMKYVERKIIKEKYSPWAVLALYEKQYGMKPVCLNTLYNYIYSGNITNVKIKHLPYKRRRKAGIYKKSRVSKNNRICRTIDDRPADVNSRTEFGHWEIDTVVGTNRGGASLLVFTERKTRLELVRKLKSRSIANVVGEIDKLEKQLGRKNFRMIFKSFTSDNGVEFLDNAGIEKDRVKLYYCHPFRSSERGSNENQNKLVRRKYKKGLSFNKVTKKDIMDLQDFINTYPRALFKGKSSTDLLQSMFASDPKYERIITKLLTIY